MIFHHNRGHLWALLGKGLTLDSLNRTEFLQTPDESCSFGRWGLSVLWAWRVCRRRGMVPQEVLQTPLHSIWQPEHGRECLTAYSEEKDTHSGRTHEPRFSWVIAVREHSTGIQARLKDPCNAAWPAWHSVRKYVISSLISQVHNSIWELIWTAIHAR